MNLNRQTVSLAAAGLLTLQLVMVAQTQQITARSNGTAIEQTTMERSPHGRSGFDTTDPVGGSTMQPGKADDTGDPALLGGERHPLYRLSKLDVIQIKFTLSPEFDQTATIQPDGYISLQNADAIFAQGLTLPELQQAVLRAYMRILYEPEVTVTLKDFDHPYFLASGEVEHPGKYELRGDLTVNEAVAIAGGFTERAKHSQVVLFRRVSADSAETHVVDLKKMLNRRNLREDLHLVPGDFVYVPQNRVSKIRKYVPASAMSWYVNPLQF